jgi:hypothetical protein
MLTRSAKEAKPTARSANSARQMKTVSAASTWETGLESPSRLLDPTTTAVMESRFGHDFSRVRIHSGPAAEASARSVGALAYTVGEHVVFGRAGFSPGNPQGLRLLGHELAHVVQQSRSGTPAPSREAEAEAERSGETAAAGRPVRVGLASTAGTLQRKQDLDEDEQKIVNASTLAAQDPKNTGKLMGRGIDILHYIVKKHFPFMTRSISKYELDEKLKGFALESSAVDTPGASGLNLKFGPDFVLGITKDNLADRVAAVGNAFKGVDAAQGKDFDKEEREGAELLRKADFGTTCGSAKGRDASDGYDATYWKETSDGVSIEATAEPWQAVKKLFEKLGQDVPKAGGGDTKWSFDCFQATQVVRLYAYFKTMSRFQFDQRFPILKIGASAERNELFPENPDYGWGTLVKAKNPKDKPFVLKDPPLPKMGGPMNFDKIEKPVGKSWKALLKEAPVGSRITWTNLDAKKQSDKAAAENAPPPPFINFVNENTTKMGDDQYDAYPFEGLLTEKEIVTKMAEAVLGDGKATAKYIQDNIFVSSLLYPKNKEKKPSTVSI